MNVRRSLITILFCLMSSLIAAVSCGPSGGTAVIGTKPTGDTPRVLELCKDEIRRYDAQVDDKVVICSVKDPIAAAKFAANAKAKAAPATGTSGAAVATGAVATESASSTGDDVGAPPPTADGTNVPVKPKVPYEAVQTPIRYSITKKDKQLEVTLKIGVTLPKDVPDRTREWALWTINNCRAEIQQAWASSGLDVSLNLPKIEMSDESRNVDQMLVFVGPQDLKPQDYPELPLQVWPDRAHLLPRASGDAIKACKGEATCEQDAIRKANEPFCRDMGLLVGHFLGLNRKATADKNACLQGASPLGVSGSGSFMKELGTAKDRTARDGHFTQSDLKRILAPACKSVRMNPDARMSEVQL